MKLLSKIISYIILITVVVVIFQKVFKKDSWDLMVCKTLMSDGVQCQTNSYILPEYKTQAQCMEKGIELAYKEGFECGKNCRNDSGIKMCEVICNRNGCSE